MYFLLNILSALYSKNILDKYKYCWTFSQNIHYCGFTSALTASQVSSVFQPSPIEIHVGFKFSEIWSFEVLHWNTPLQLSFSSQLSVADVVFISSELLEVPSPEHEEGIIPDSPILPSSLPVANRLKKRRNIDKTKHVRYAEMPLPQTNNTLFSGQSALL